MFSGWLRLRPARSGWLCPIRAQVRPVHVRLCGDSLYGPSRARPTGAPGGPRRQAPWAWLRITAGGGTSGRPAAGAGVERGTRRCWAAAWPAASSAVAHRRGPLPLCGQPRTCLAVVPPSRIPGGRAAAWRQCRMRGRDRRPGALGTSRANYAFNPGGLVRPPLRPAQPVSPVAAGKPNQGSPARAAASQTVSGHRTVKVMRGRLPADYALPPA
jgi:hypothetical protein